MSTLILRDRDGFGAGRRAAVFFLELVLRAGVFLLDAFLRVDFLATDFLFTAALFLELFFGVVFFLLRVFFEDLLEAFFFDDFLRALVAVFLRVTFFLEDFFLALVRLAGRLATFFLLDDLADARLLLERTAGRVVFLPAFFLVFLAAAFFAGISSASKTYRMKQAIIHTPPGSGSPEIAD